jgi:hypothetical protein
MRVKPFSSFSGLSVSRVYRLARQDKIKLVREGGTTLVDVDQAMGYLENLPDYREVPPSYWGQHKVPPKCRKKRD